MFESWPTVEPPGGPGAGWSACAPDGLLAEALSGQSGGSCAERLERVAAWERVIAWAQAAQLREIAGFVTEAGSDPEFGDDAEQAHRSACASIGLVTRVAAGTAANRVHDASVLVERLPAIWDALSSGRITLPSARAVAEETLGLDARHLDEAQTRILERAAGQTTGQVRAHAKRVVARLDAEAVRRRAEQARRERSVSLDPEPDGMATLRAYLPAHEAVAAYEVLGDYARRAGCPDNARTMDARRADALVDLILRPGTPDPDEPPTAGRNRASAQILVTVSLTTLLGLDQLPAELAGYGPIPADVARELAAEGTWRRLITDPVTGSLLDFGTARYRPPPNLAEFVITRDQTCGFPGCRVPAHRCRLDHTVPFDPQTRAGPTNADDLRPLSRAHHLLKHSPGWSLVRNSDDSLTWTAPTGHRFTRHPPRIGEPDRAPAPVTPSPRESPPEQATTPGAGPEP
ncbi:HNH endonuclease signature motif containing protein [Pseudonocardia acaciae]|uniref:HNH endonuclease signature motif containing protein n=1 Tax=Pseudonocardia acaciae TaxID=551276 RepID=UPI000685E77C|nr:HNH endonuclease signature motif containing protein [Pseudonocardia acaciae]